MPGDPTFAGRLRARNLAEEYAKNGLPAYLWHDPVRDVWHVEIGVPDPNLPLPDIQAFEAFPSPTFEDFVRTSVWRYDPVREEMERARRAEPGEVSISEPEAPPPVETYRGVTAVQCVNAGAFVSGVPIKTCSLVRDGETLAEVGRLLHIEMEGAASAIRSKLGDTFTFSPAAVCQVQENAATRMNSLACRQELQGA